MFDETVVQRLKDRYNAVHPLIFSRSVERSKSPGELYDILESLPSELPVMWDHSSHRWITTTDITRSQDFDLAVG